MLQEIIERFEALSKIPRGSKNLDGVRKYIKNWADGNGYEYQKDTYGNCAVHIRKKDSKTNIIIQSHMDMVCASHPESKHNFNTDPIKIKIDHKNDTMYASNTTLGADNGIGLVCSMLVAEKYKGDNDLYLLFTADEEIGLVGAENLSLKLPKKAVVFNVDSEWADKICVGSVGGFVTKFSLGGNTLMVPGCKNTIVLEGFRGGHSGVEIDKGGGNAIKEMFRLLNRIEKKYNTKTKIIDIKGGEAQNSIPRSCVCSFTTSRRLDDTVGAFINCEVEKIKKEYNEPKIICNYSVDNSDTVGILEDSDQLAELINLTHHGPLSMNPYISNSLRSSTNIGTVSVKDGVIEVCCLSRSIDREVSEEYYGRLKQIASRLDVKINEFDFKSGWNSDIHNSDCLKVLKKAYAEKHGKEPPIYTIHAGLECGILKEKFPDWDIMSFGPEIVDAHTFNEHIVLSTIQPFYEWLFDAVIFL